jgi:hypothetical protein
MATRTFHRVPSLKYPSCLDDPVRRATSASGQASATFMAVDRLDTAVASLEAFNQAFILCKDDPNVTGVSIAAVGLKAGKRQSVFDLYGFPSTGVVYAVDARDNNFVCVSVPSRVCVVPSNYDVR